MLRRIVFPLEETPVIQTSSASLVSTLRVSRSTPVERPVPRCRLSVRSFGLTDVGRLRRENEDQFLIAEIAQAVVVQRPSLTQPNAHFAGQPAYLFAVADGMGGHAGGLLASTITMDLLERFAQDTLTKFSPDAGVESELLLEELQHIVSEADARLIKEARVYPEFHGMGTTLTLAYSRGDEVLIAHVGDSRCYLLRGDRLEQLTTDHSMAQEMVRRGMISPEEAATHAWRHIIVNALGGNEPGVNVETRQVQVQAGDRLLVCSDGLTDLISNQDLATILKAEPKPEAACQRLVNAANERGGRDNSTALVVCYDEAPAEGSR
jgi:protein phosphatase